jgi:ribonucleoside-triphosphate reductase (thioredoxin)
MMKAFSDSTSFADQYGEVRPFALPAEAVERLRLTPPPWGFGAMSEMVFLRTYAYAGEGWLDCCVRVVEGMFSVIKTRCLAAGRPWSEGKGQQMAVEALEGMFHFKWVPPGRGLRMMGNPFLLERTSAAANNCGFTSTARLSDRTGRTEPFTWAFEMLMLGVGVGFDVKGAHSFTIGAPDNAKLVEDATDTSPRWTIGSRPVHFVDDSREGWIEAYRLCLHAFFADPIERVRGGVELPHFDVSGVRPKGAPIKGMGGVSSGPEALTDLISTTTDLLMSRIGQPIDAETICDLFNLIGRCVVCGGVRRSSEIALGPFNEEWARVKGKPERGEWSWASNNSGVPTGGKPSLQTVEGFIDAAADGGDIGFFDLDMARHYGRTGQPGDVRDKAACGTNPCGEQTLHDMELCCLVETFPAHHATLEDYKRTLRLAYLYAKAVTMLPTHSAVTNRVIESNRRIGCSMSGVVQLFERLGPHEALAWASQGYREVQRVDELYSIWLGIPRSVKTTSIKPSGTVSLLAGATPGVHWDHSPHYVRRVRVADSSPLLDQLDAAGYPIEPDVKVANTVCVEFPIHVRATDRAKHEVSAREKAELAVLMQQVWADNQVSCTVDYRADERPELANLVHSAMGRTKAMSFLPALEGGAFPQMPYEEIDAQEYARRVERIRPVVFHPGAAHDQEDKFCDGDACAMPQLED